MDEYKIIKLTKNVKEEYKKCILGYASLDEAFEINEYLSEGENTGFSMSLAEFIKRMSKGESRSAVAASLARESKLRFIYNPHLVQALLFISLSANGKDCDRTTFMDAIYDCFTLIPPEYSKYSVETFERKPFNLYGVNAINCVNVDYFLEDDA